jgi:deoxyribodipyrimidine photo-lyase
MNVVWLKRDARVLDHEPLSLAAAEKLPCIVLYIYEPEILTSDTYHESHHKFINEGLAELDLKLRAAAVDGSGGLTLRTGSALHVLQTLHNSLPIRTIFSHLEVGNGISRHRNETIAAWSAATGIRWCQCSQDGVSEQRHAELDEGSWSHKWTQHMLRMQHPPPTRLLFVHDHTLPRGSLCDAASCGVAHRGSRPSAQTGGEAAAHGILHSFLERRGEGYCDELSSPLTGWDSCSRLSPYGAALASVKYCNMLQVPVVGPCVVALGIPGVERASRRAARHEEMWAGHGPLA